MRGLERKPNKRDRNGDVFSETMNVEESFE